MQPNSPSLGNRWSVLIVDGNRPRARLLSSHFRRRQGEPIRLVSDETQMLVALDQQRYDLLLWAIVPSFSHPRIEAYLHQIKRRSPGIWVVGMLEGDWRSLLAACRLLGCDDCLVMPLREAAILQLLHNFFHHCEARMSPSDLLNPLMPYPAYLDGDRLQRVTQGRVEVQLRLLDYFVQGMTTALQEAEQALAQRDSQALYFRGHQMKGSAANCGLITIRALAQQLEQVAQGEAFEEASLLLTQLQEQLTELREFVAQGQKQLKF